MQFESGWLRPRRSAIVQLLFQLALFGFQHGALGLESAFEFALDVFVLLAQITAGLLRR